MSFHLQTNFSHILQEWRIIMDCYVPVYLVTSFETVNKFAEKPEAKCLCFHLCDDRRGENANDICICLQHGTLLWFYSSVCNTDGSATDRKWKGIQGRPFPPYFQPECSLKACTCTCTNMLCLLSRYELHSHKLFLK